MKTKTKFLLLGGVGAFCAGVVNFCTPQNIFAVDKEMNSQAEILEYFGGSDYVSLENGKVKLLQNLSTSYFSVVSTDAISIDLNGHDITLSGGSYGGIIIKDNSKFEIGGSGTVTLNSIGSLFMTEKGGELTINGGNYRADRGNIIKQRGLNSKLTINDGNFECGYGGLIAHEGAVSIEAGKADFNGGTIRATAERGDAVYIMNGSKTTENPENYYNVTFNGGNYISDIETGVHVTSDSADTQSKVVVNDGYFEGARGSFESLVGNYDAVKLKGGRYVAKPKTKADGDKYGNVSVEYSVTAVASNKYDEKGVLKLLESGYVFNPSHVSYSENHSKITDTETVVEKGTLIPEGDDSDKGSTAKPSTGGNKTPAAETEKKTKNPNTFDGGVAMFAGSVGVTMLALGVCIKRLMGRRA